MIKIRAYNRNVSATGCGTSRHQLFQIHPYLGDGILVVASHKSFLYLVRICPKIPVKLNSSWLEVFGLDRFGLDHFLGSSPARDGISVDPLLCRESSEGKYGSCAKRLGCEGEIVGKIGEVSERELVLVSV